jgi:hypothetical protein
MARLDTATVTREPGGERKTHLFAEPNPHKPVREMIADSGDPFG